MDQMFLQTGLAVAEGIALIASPCIWPILPLILSASISGGRRRPFGVIVGFILSFAAFAWASRWLVGALGLDLDTIKYGSLVLLALFGLVLLSSKLSEKFGALTIGVAGLGARVSSSNTGGFFSGVGVGALIGLVWTPCAGPILAAVLVQIIRQPSDIQSLVVLLSFAFGVGVPMGMVALMGRTVLNKLGFVRTHALALRRFFGVLILLSVALIASGVDLPTYIQQQNLPEKLSVWIKGGTTMNSAQNEGSPAQAATPAALIDGLAQPYPAPRLVEGGSWINSPPLTMAALKGKVVLIDFWTYSCINCLRTLPSLTMWDTKYRDKGLVIIGLHAPEFAFEKDLRNVQSAVTRYAIRYPVMQDNDLATWTLYNNRYWPAHYLIDRSGNVVYTHFGEGRYDVTEHNIQALLGEAPIPQKADQAVSEAVPYDPGQTPETYLGQARATSMANEDEGGFGIVSVYTFPPTLDKGAWALQGAWMAGREKIVSSAADARLRLRFQAKKVFLVLGTEKNEPIDVAVTLNNAPLNNQAGQDVQQGRIHVKETRLYELVNQTAFQEGILELKASAPGLEAYAFTFGR